VALIICFLPLLMAGMSRAGSVFTLSPTGAVATETFGVNNFGQVVGSYATNG
jgi:hypothetical protein